MPVRRRWWSVRARRSNRLASSTRGSRARASAAKGGEAASCVVSVIRRPPGGASPCANSYRIIAFSSAYDPPDMDTDTTTPRAVDRYADVVVIGAGPIGLELA